jgi:hypothetical protein
MSAHRTGAPVRPQSQKTGTVEHRIWHAFDPERIGPTMKAAEQFDRQHKLPGQRNGALGHVALDVLRELLRIVDYTSGRLEPSYDWLMKQLRRSRGAIAGALARLRKHGFLDWVRRTRPREDAGGEGPQIEQDTNAYWFKLPHECAAFVLRKLGKAPREAKTRQQVIAEAAAERIEAMRARRPGISAADVLTEGAKEALALLRSKRSSASQLSRRNPAIKG